MRYTIDRFEDDIAVCEDENREMVTIPRSALPGDAREGDLLQFSDGNYLVDREGTAERKEQMRKKMMDLFE